MKKIGILTINDDVNYGNRLQNYALQEFLKKREIEVETILNRPGLIGYRYYVKQMKDFIKKILFFKKDYKRYLNFKKFNQKFIKFSKYRIDQSHIPDQLVKDYDYFITGSDQVWNPYFGRMSNIDFLTFAPKTKRISFSASFGISELPDNMKEWYKNGINGLNKISVREERGRDIIKELTGREDAIVLLDPTMLLSKKEWDKVAKKPKQMKTNEKYILNYFLGELSNSRMDEIQRIANQNNCRIINILNENDPFFECDPSEFLYLEKNAYLICTDSFHSSVFAILYDRPFIIFDREDKHISMNSRLETLIKKFQLKNRKFKGKITDENLNHDYTKAYEILEQEREKAEKFLEEVFINDKTNSK